MNPYVSSNTSPSGVTTIEFGTPAHNSLPGEQLQQLVDAFDDAAKNEACKVVILRSAGNRTFCAGASFDELKAVSNEAEGLAFFSGFANVINAMRRCPKFVLGLVQGKAVGGGVGLLSACDLVYATKFASIKLSELAIGIGPFVIGPAVERRGGSASFNEMAIRANEWFDSAYAKTNGFYTEVFDNLDEVEEAVAKKAETLAGYHVEAMELMKKVLWTGTDHWPVLLTERAAISGTLVTRPWTREALSKV